MSPLFFKKKLEIAVKWLLLCTLVAIVVGSASAGFLYSLDWAGTYRDAHQWLIWLLPIAGFGLGTLYFYFGKDINAGNNLVISEIENPKEKIPLKMSVMIYIGTICTHLFGGSAGREGTAIQMAASLSDQLGYRFKITKPERQILLLSATAAGFGSVFGTPYSGVAFALELVFIGGLRYWAIVPCLLSAVGANFVTLWWQAPHTHYSIGSTPHLSAISILYVALAGILFGFAAKIFSNSLHHCTKLWVKLISYPPLRLFVGGLMVSLFVYFWGDTKYIGLGIPNIVSSFGEASNSYDFALKMLLTIITLSAGFKGGEVTPLFFIGATLGSALSLAIPLPTGLLAAMGFVAVFSGATHTPIACTIMAVELFGIQCLPYALIACAVAYFSSGSVSIYNFQTVASPKYRRYFRKNDFKNL